VAGVGGNATAFGTTITALRILITVHEGRSKYRLSAVVAPQGGATINQTNATNATAAASGKSAAATTSVTNTSQPSSTASSAATAAAASQNLNYPFTLLEMLENDEIPQPPPAATPPS
jgi:general secretion pathway protein K